RRLVTRVVVRPLGHLMGSFVGLDGHKVPAPTLPGRRSGQGAYDGVRQQASPEREDHSSGARVLGIDEPLAHEFLKYPAATHPAAVRRVAAQVKSLGDAHAEHDPFQLSGVLIEDLASGGRAESLVELVRVGAGVLEIPPPHPADVAVRTRTEAPPVLA